MFFNQLTRRDLLKSVAATLSAWLLPHRLFATSADPRFHFIHADSCTSWPITDPVAWALENQGEPILERAAEGLAKLTEADDERVVRLVVRRCGLNLLELRPETVIVHHWSHQQADLRPFFKTHRLTRPEIVVQLRDRKKEAVTTKTGDSFLYGTRIAPDFPLDLYQSRFASRFTKEPDDWQAAPRTWSGFAWANTEDGRIPWAALKSAWRRATPGVCQNCDTSTLLVNFGHRQVGMFNRSPNFVSACGECRRSFLDDSIKDVPAWIERNLDAEVWPGFEMVWGRRVKWETTT